MRVALLGLGEQMTDNLLPTVIQLPQVDIVAICDINSDKLALYHKKLPHADMFLDINDLFANGEFDVVVVSSYPIVHDKALQLAIQYNKHIFVEKPPTTSLAKLEAILSRLESSSIKTGVGFNFNFAEVVRKLDDCLLSGELGEVVSIRVNHFASKPREFSFWGMYSLYQSFLLAQAIHPIAFVLKYLDTINLDKVTHRKVLSDNSIQLEIGLVGENRGIPVLASIFTNNMAPHFDSSIEFITSKNCIIHLNSLWSLSVSVSSEQALLGKRSRFEWSPSPVGNGLIRSGYYHELGEFFESIRNNIDFKENLLFAKKVYQVMDQL